MTTKTTETERFARMRDFERSLYLMPYEVLRAECIRIHTMMHGVAHLQRYLNLGGYETVSDCTGSLAYDYANGVTVFGETL